MAVSADAVVEYMKAKRWNNVRDWMFNNSAIHPRQVERELYTSIEPHLTGQGKAMAVLKFGEYSSRIGHGADPVITLLALATELMLEADWK